MNATVTKPSNLSTIATPYEDLFNFPLEHTFVVLHVVVAFIALVRKLKQKTGSQRQGTFSFTVRPFLVKLLHF